MRYCYALLMFFTLVLSAHAQERVFSEYQYDEVGNTTSITQDQSGAAPSIDSFTPAVVRQNQVVDVTVNGDGLRGATIESIDSFSFSNIQSTNEQLNFTLTVSENALEGASEVLLSTGLGTTSFSLNVLTELPDLRVSPTPVVLTLGSSSNLLVSLSQTDVLNHDVTISIADTSVATLDISSINIQAGQIKPDQIINLLPVSEGATRILFESESLGSFSYTLRVNSADETFEQNAVNGDVGRFVSQNVGVNKLFIAPPPEIVPVGPFVDQLSVVRQSSPIAPTDQDAFSFSNSVGVLKGSFISAITPNALPQGSNNTITISGVGLLGVESAQIIPDDNVIAGDLSIASDGQSLSLSVGVAEGTEFSQRQIILQTAENTITPITPAADRFWVGGSTPVVDSISPIFLNRNDVATITVRGSNLQAVTAVSFENSEGLIFSEPTIANDGLSLTFELQVLQFALIGPRQLVLETSLGDSQALNVDAATLFVQDQPPLVISPVTAPLVGINRLSNQGGAIDNDLTSFALPVGITRGATLTRLQPQSSAQGSTVTLNLDGVNLSSVTSAEFEPATGITVGELNASSDGLSATLEIEIATDAETTTRQLRLSNGVSFIGAVTSQDRFTVVTTRPEINSVSPLQIAQGDISVPLVIRGQLFNDASSVSFTPADGITVAPLNVSLDGTVIETQLIISEGATLGPRIVQVTTPGGTTEALLSVNNTVQIVETISAVVTPVISSFVGVIKQEANESPTPISLDRQRFSNTVGIIKEALPEQLERLGQGFAQAIGVAKGPVAQSVTPNRLTIGSTNQTIQVTGAALDNVVTVRTVPAQGVTLNGPAIISADGNTITFTADVDQDAELTSRRLEMVTSDDVIIPFALPQNSVLQVTGLTPQIDSIEPIQEARGSSFLMTIRGINFVDVQSIQATPASGIQFSTPTVAADGRSLTVQVVIDNDAVTEDKVIQVITTAGSTISISMPENTFTVISE